jgi:predicted lipoprotein with Yx(FWY)xxD motif
MKRTYILLACVLASAVSGSTMASASGGHAAATAKLELRHTHLGSILTTAAGLTLYEFTRDHTREDSCVKIQSCPQSWPALVTSGKPLAGAGVNASLLSTITLRGGAKQVTYAGHALYMYIADSPGSTAYVGVRAFGGNWYAVNGSGQRVK